MKTVAKKSFFNNVKLCPQSPSLDKAFNDDTNAVKVNLCFGVYRTDSNLPYVLPAVKRAEARIVQNANFNHEYLPAGGSTSFTNAAIEFLLGKESQAILEHRVYGYQTISGTGALRLGADLLVQGLGVKTVFVSNPTWENHWTILRRAGIEDVRTYRYWESKTRSLDVDGMIEDLDDAPAGSVVIMQACAHNPTGCDPTPAEWIRIADTLERKNLLVFFDAAYQGFASGDTTKDAFAVRHFASRDIEFLCAQSFSKTFGLYGHRVGSLTIVHRPSSTFALVIEQLNNMVADSYLNPPVHGARIVQTILGDHDLYEEWKQNLEIMVNRLKSMRQGLYDELVRLKTPGSWGHIIAGYGMFTFTGLTKEQHQFIIDNYHVYTRKTSRLSLCALNAKNLAYVAEAIHGTVKAIPD